MQFKLSLYIIIYFRVIVSVLWCLLQLSKIHSVHWLQLWVCVMYRQTIWDASKQKMEEVVAREQAPWL